MRIHANHPNFTRFDVFLGGAKILFAWVADEEEGYVEVYEKDECGHLRLAEPKSTCLVNDRTGKILPVAYQGRMEETKDGKKVPINLIQVEAPWAQTDLAPPVKVYGRVEIRARDNPESPVVGS